MPPEQQQPVRFVRTFSDRIAPVSPDVLVEALSHDKTRAKVKSMIDDYVNSVPFEELVMKYAGKEIEKRSLGTFRFWGTTIAIAAATGILGALAALAIRGHG